MIKLATILFTTIFFQFNTFGNPIEVNHIRNEHLDEYNDQNFVPLTKDDISRIQLNLDDELENFTKFKGQVRKFTKKKVNPIQYVDKKIVKRGALLEKDGQYFISPIAFLALVSHTQTSYFSQILNEFEEEEYNIRNIDLMPFRHFAELQVKPERRLDYPKKSLLKENLDKFPLLFKFDLQTELFKEGYLDELSNSDSNNEESENAVPSLAAGLGAAFHLLTNTKSNINFGAVAFIHTGTWFSGFEKTLYQSLYFGPEVTIKVGSIEDLNIYVICELTRSLWNTISNQDKTIDIFLRNSSYKIGVELKAPTYKSTWYTGAYYRLIESSLGRETSNDVPKPRYRKNSNAFGLYFGRTFDFYW